MRILRIVAMCLLAWPLAIVASITSQTVKSPTYVMSAFPSTCATTFPFQAQADLMVLDIGPASALFATAKTLTLNSDYTVTGGGYNSQNGMQTGSVVVVATGSGTVAVNDQIIILRNVAVNQIQTFTSGPLTASLIEQALDKTATISQQLTEEASRALRFPTGDTFDGTLPAATARPNTILGFNSAGGVALIPLTSAPAYNVVLNSVTSIAALRLVPVATLNLSTGQSIIVTGYYAANDGGGGVYVWNSASTAPDNGGTIIAPVGVASGRWLLSGWAGDVRIFGVLPGNSPSTNDAALANLLAVLITLSNATSTTSPALNSIVFYGNNVYNISSSINCKLSATKYLNVLGQGGTPVIAMNNGSDIFINVGKGDIFDSIRTTFTAATARTIVLETGGYDVTISNCVFANATTHIYGTDHTGLTVQNTVFTGASVYSVNISSDWWSRWYNVDFFDTAGITFAQGHSHHFYGGRFEGCTNVAVQINANGDFGELSFYGTHWENSNAQDVNLTTTAAVRIRDVQFHNCFIGGSLVTDFVDGTAGAGGNIDKIAFYGGWWNLALPLVGGSGIPAGRAKAYSFHVNAGGGSLGTCANVDTFSDGVITSSTTVSSGVNTGAIASPNVGLGGTLGGMSYMGGGLTFGTSGSVLSGATGSIGITAGGSNQSITLTPSGSGAVNVSSNLALAGTATNAAVNIAFGTNTGANLYGLSDLYGTYSLSSPGTEVIPYRAYSTLALGANNLTNWYGFNSTLASKTGAGTLTNAYAFYANSPTAAANNYAFYSSGSAPSVLGGGLEMGAPTGGDKGAGTINVATGIYLNGTAYTNPDYVLEQWATGKIVRYANKLGAREYRGLPPLEDVEEAARRDMHLQGFGQKSNNDIFSGSEALLARVEEAYIYLFKHDHALAEVKLELRVTEVIAMLALILASRANRKL